jgi:anion-transporting  ArsA/GET3 family ATPase
VGYQPKSIRNGLSLAQLNSESAFEEYVIRQIKFKFIYNAVFNNQYVRHFIDAAPGLAELLTIGKIWALVEDEVRVGKKRQFDLVIVDAPSTGHGLSLLTVADVVVDAVRLGPMKNHAEGIIKLLRNPKETLTWLVTLPEEMPVNEAIEMEKKLVEQAKVEVGPILINSLWPNVLSEKSQKSFQKENFKDDLLKSYLERKEQADFYLSKIQHNFSKRHLIGLPLIYQTSTPLQIAERLQEIIHQNILEKTS